MKISIWRQFSANHSSSYEVVGVFRSAEEAQNAAETIVNIMIENARWYHDNKLYPGWIDEPTPVEKKYAKQYNFDWQEPVDWATYNVKKPIDHYDRIVSIDTSSVDTWQTGHQFVNLLEAMGADVYREVFAGRDPQYKQDDWGHSGTFYAVYTFELRCISNDTTTANRILTDLHEVFKQDTGYDSKEPIPWLRYHPALADYKVSKIQKMEFNYLRDFNDTKRKYDFEQHKFIERCRRDVVIQKSEVSTIEQHHTTIIMKGILISRLAIGFEVFFKYLKSLGCERTEYTFGNQIIYIRDEDGNMRVIQP